MGSQTFSVLLDSSRGAYVGTPFAESPIYRADTIEKALHFAFAFNEAYIDKNTILTSMPPRYIIHEVHDGDIIRYLPRNEAWQYHGGLEAWSVFTEKEVTEKPSESKPLNDGDAVLMDILRVALDSSTDDVL